MAAADHLQVPRQHGLFQHHGIDLGDGTVAHYLEGREILRSPLHEFSCGEKLSIVSHTHSSSRNLTLRRAMSRIGEKNYNLLFNNCEHFACWCKTGRHRSEQMENWLKTTTSVARALSKLLPPTLNNTLSIIMGQEFSENISRKNYEIFLEKIKTLRLSCIRNLNQILLNADKLISRDSEKMYNRYQTSNTRTLLLKGQAIANKITLLEDLENKINNHLKINNSSMKSHH